MKIYSTALFATGFLAMMATPSLMKAQGSSASPLSGSMAAAQPHLDKAKEAAWRPKDGLNDLTKLYETVCGPALSAKGPDVDQEPGNPEKHKTPPRSDWYQEPAKVFDNLYWLGSWGSASRVPTRGEISPAGNSTWAVTTSAGIILIDSGMDYTAPTLIGENMKKAGLDPSQIKYLILTHAHSDRYWGAKFVQDTYHAHLITSETDWHGIEISSDPEDVKPKKDMVATDGMKLTLGDTTLTIYSTPGHSPGTISVLVPLKDGNEKHLGAVWGGINANLYGHGVRNGASLAAVDKMWIASATHFMEIANKAGVDTYLTIHPFYDNAIQKIHLLQYRKPGEPNIMVGKENFNRFMTIIKECTEAELARIEGSTHGATGQ